MPLPLVCAVNRSWNNKMRARLGSAVSLQFVLVVCLFPFSFAYGEGPVEGAYGGHSVLPASASALVSRDMSSVSSSLADTAVPASADGTSDTTMVCPLGNAEASCLGNDNNALVRSSGTPYVLETLVRPLGWRKRLKAQTQTPQLPPGHGGTDDTAVELAVVHELVRALAPSDSEYKRVVLALPSVERLALPPSEMSDNSKNHLMVNKIWRLINEKAFAKGAFGEVWRATRLPKGGRFVVKRLAGAAHEDGLWDWDARREVAFGRFVQAHQRLAEDGDDGLQHLARFVEAFESEALAGVGGTSKQRHGGSDDDTRDLWIVFHDEGVSLHSLLVDAPTASDGLLRQSSWWRSLRNSGTQGASVLRDLLRQVLLGISFLHRHGIAHRDLKADNLFVNGTHVRLGDLGSAAIFGEAYGPGAAELAAAQMFAEDKLSMDELTAFYAGPEVLLREDGDASASADAAYDMWSFGVLCVELLAIGTPHIFMLDGKAAAIEDAKLQREGGSRLSREKREQRHLRAAMTLLCIVDHDDDCDDDAVAKELARRAGGQEVSGGLEAVRLIRALLRYEPARRLSAEQALQHAFFRGGARKKLVV
ncbi:hypothetical protein PPROV_001033300 [Pycnococcus provasolii]|uniref:Protein kinase domain-containing protein n=2 Tax=Pycnococcus provasolii TaxID=41880 RepID=A0A830HYE8_9CHLO|nr:hypothetical protein PPROV_001033300 [Pycnococcus provasolii]|mmetsp:Transcript_2726/g.7434  ORF Transcript_2726/g.7434 Transcript_2726/m.7434 type:complete len:592 (-) Transcript_2726:29-1804(-)